MIKIEIENAEISVDMRGSLIDLSCELGGVMQAIAERDTNGILVDGALLGLICAIGGKKLVEKLKRISEFKDTQTKPTNVKKDDKQSYLNELVGILKGLDKLVRD